MNKIFVILTSEIFSMYVNHKEKSDGNKTKVFSLDTVISLTYAPFCNELLSNLYCYRGLNM